MQKYFLRLLWVEEDTGWLDSMQVLCLDIDLINPILLKVLTAVL